MRQCIRCKKNFPLTSFNWIGLLSGRLSKVCKTCSKSKGVVWPEGTAGLLLKIAVPMSSLSEDLKNAGST